MSWTDSDKPKGNPVDAAHLRKFGAVMAAAFGILSAVAGISRCGIPFFRSTRSQIFGPIGESLDGTCRENVYSDDLADSHVDVFCPHYTDWPFTQIDLARQL